MQVSQRCLLSLWLLRSLSGVAALAASSPLFPSLSPLTPASCAFKKTSSFSFFFFHLLLQLWGSQTIAVSPPKSSLIKRRFPLHSVCPSLPHYQHLANLALSCQGPSDSCNELHSENVIFVPPFHTMEASSTRLSQPE